MTVLALVAAAAAPAVLPFPRATGGTATDLHPPLGTLPIQGVGYHGMWSEYDAAERAATLDLLAGAGVRWVRMDVSWAMLQPDGPGAFDPQGVQQVDVRLQELADRGFSVLVMFWWAPRWSSGTDAKNGVPADPADYGRAAAWVADHWRDKIAAIELWNEPNRDEYLLDDPSGSRRFDAVAFTAMLREAYPRIKAVNPGITVVSGGTAAVDTDYLERVYANGGAGMFDAVGVHPYPAYGDQPLSQCDQQQEQWYPCNLSNLSELMRTHGDGGKPVWATEYGWSTHPSQPGAKPWELGVTPQEQADYVIDAQSFLSLYSSVQAGFIYVARDKSGADPHQNGFGIITRDGEPKPALAAVRCAITGDCRAAQ